MNKQSLYLVGGALLTSTALVTSAQAAATIKSSATYTEVLSTSAITAKSLATEVFSGTTTTANSATISGGTGTSPGTILIDISPQFAAFDLKLEISSATAAFATTPAPTVVYFTETTTGSLIQTLSVTGCTVQPSSERISLLNCNPSVNQLQGSKVDVIGIVGVTYTQAAALRTSGTSITLSGATYQAGTNSTFDSITPAVVVTSKSAASDTAVQTGTNATIDNTATVPFATLVASGVTTATVATLGSVHFSTNGALGTDLANPFNSSASLITSAELKVTHSVLSDTALSKISYSGTNKVASDFVSGTVSFTVGGASVVSAITATFSGTTAISNSSGTATATVTSTAGGIALSAPAAFSGSLSSLTRGGLSVELNSVLPGAMQASYISFLRIANQSTIASTATLTVKKDSDATAVGTFTTASIPAGGTLQLSSVDIDNGLTAAGATPLTNAAYKVTVTGNFNGYVQNLLYNVANQGFADASGFRNGTLTTDP